MRGEEATRRQVGGLLNTSHTFVIGLLDKGDIPSMVEVGQGLSGG